MVALGALLGLTALAEATPASAGTVTWKLTPVPGAMVTATSEEPYPPNVTLTLQTLHTVSITCAADQARVNAIKLGIGCGAIQSFTVIGSSGNDTVSVDERGFAGGHGVVAFSVDLGGGNDIGSLDGGNGGTILGGTGDDVLRAGLRQDSMNGGPDEALQVLEGGAGNDTLVNRGHLDPAPPAIDWTDTFVAQQERARLRGGPGVDRYSADDVRWTEAVIDASDVLDLDDKPSTVSIDAGTEVEPAFVYTQAGGDPFLGNDLQLRRSHRADLRCTATSPGNPASSLVVSGFELPVRCATRPLTVRGTEQADAVTYDQTSASGIERYGVQLQIVLGGGNDTATIRHPYGSVGVDGGAGNDSLTIGVHNSVRNSENTDTARLLGGPGNDTLTNQGFVDPKPPAYDPKQPPSAVASTASLDGGAGTDAIKGSTNQFERVTAETVDTLLLNTGPGTLDLSTTTGADTVLVHNNGNYGTLLTVTTGGTAKKYTLPTLLQDLRIRTLGGNDSITVEHKSASTPVTIDAGAGTDTLRIRPRNPYAWDKTAGIVTQPGWKTISYVKAAIEQVTVASY
ncbi:MAG: Ca2+-binding protein toxin [Acidimicrobiales bacterium]|nr:Ca2+-binding protein toxin [Acidimicrobiales bacterium]